MDCPTCGMELRRVPWNSAVDVFVCDNTHCTKFKEPIPIPVGAETPKDASALKERMKEVRLEESLTKKLQRVRSILYPKD